MANPDVVNTCISTKPTRFGGLVVGVNGLNVVRKQETYEYKIGTSILTMNASGNYDQTGSPNLSGILLKYDNKFDDTTYYSN